MTTTPKSADEQMTGYAPDANSRTEDLDSSTRQPGNLQGSATLVIQTRQAQRLLRGRPQSGEKARIVGLYHFSGKMRTIWMAACQDDPYADWYLLQVQERIEETRTELGRLQRYVLARLQSVPGIEVNVAQSAAPVPVPLRFGTPYGYMGAYLISDFDRLVRAILTAQHMGLLPRDNGEQLIRYSSKLIRRVLTIPLGWKPLTICRDDVRQDNQRAQTARRQMGDLPDGILAGTRRAHVAPTIPTTTVDHDKANQDDRSDQDQSDKTKTI